MEKIEEGDYGPVLIVKGKYKGKTGYYDDDEGAKAIVYLNGAPGIDDAHYVVVLRSSLIPIENTISLARLKKQNPEVVALAGIVTNRNKE